MDSLPNVYTASSGNFTLRDIRASLRALYSDIHRLAQAGQDDEAAALAFAFSKLKRYELALQKAELDKKMVMVSIGRN